MSEQTHTTHRFTRAINELFQYCPDKYANGVWNSNRTGFLAWKERELLNRCYTEKGFIAKLEAYVQELKDKRTGPHTETTLRKSPLERIKPARPIRAVGTSEHSEGMRVPEPIIRKKAEEKFPGRNVTATLRFLSGSLRTGS